ncbi:mitochondrial carrier domain-containing protein [Flammula alnicola]|nr:mitochondrial carrier domain-containing protein [Flammula alnicola]
MSSDKRPTFVQSLLAGGVAGTSVDLLFFPIDTIKTRLQSLQGFRVAGGFSGIYKGVGSVVVGSAPGAAAFFSTYETMKKTLPLSEGLAPVKHMISASVAEVAACLIRVPTEVIKTRMQTSTYGALGGSSWAAARLVLANDGFWGFYRGFGITVMREIPFTSLQFPLYELLKLQLSYKLNRKPLYAHEAAACGSIAGGVAAALTTPLDVLKTRVMLDTRVNIQITSPPHPCPKLQDPSKEKLPSLPSRLRTIYITEGPKALFAGVVPRTLWISAGGAVFLGVYEWAVHGLMGI